MYRRCPWVLFRNGNEEPWHRRLFLHFGGFGRDVILRARAGWNPVGAPRIWKAQAPAYGLYDAPAALHKILRRFCSRYKNSLALLGLKRQASVSDSCLYFVVRRCGGGVGPLTTHMDDTLGCGVPDIFSRGRQFLEG